MEIITLLFLLIVIIITLKGIIIVKQQEAIIIESWGKYKCTLNPGLNFITPFFEKPRPIAKFQEITTADGKTYSSIVYSPRIDLRETVYTFSCQNILTKDNLTISTKASLYFQIVKPIKAVYGVENLPKALESLTQTTVRDSIRQFIFDEAIDSKDTINNEIRETLNESTDKWGVKVNKVEIQDISPTASI